MCVTACGIDIGMPPGNLKSTEFYSQYGLRELEYFVAYLQ